MKKKIGSLKKISFENFVIGSQCGGFQFMLILDLWGISFHTVVVFGLGKNLLFKSIDGGATFDKLNTADNSIQFWTQEYVSGTTNWVKAAANQNNSVVPKSGDKLAIEAEFGDVLFSIINYSRFLKINPESALERTNKKFIRRFKYIETAAKIKGISIESLSLDEMETFWIAAKNQFSSEDSNS